MVHFVIDNTVEAYYETFHLYVISCHGDFVHICEAPLNGLTLTLHFLRAFMVFQTHGHNLTRKINISAYSLTSPFKRIKLVPLILNQKPNTSLRYWYILFYVFPELISKSYRTLSHHVQTIPSPSCISLSAPFCPPQVFFLCAGGPAEGKYIEKEKHTASSSAQA